MIDFNERPFIVIWEVTQACDLACVHCRASAQSWRSPLELSIEAGKWLIDEAAALKIPVFVLTGGDPLKRPDTFDLVEYAAAQGVSVSLTPSTTPLLTNEAIARLKGSGLARLAISLDGPTAQIHDAFRRISGSYDCTSRAARYAREIDLPVQINTTITRHNLPLVNDVIEMLAQRPRSSKRDAQTTEAPPERRRRQKPVESSHYWTVIVSVPWWVICPDVAVI